MLCRPDSLRGYPMLAHAARSLRPSLRPSAGVQVPFYSVLGNHDYGVATATGNHSIVPQMEFTWADPNGQWYLPNRYYRVSPDVLIPVSISAVDT